MQEFYAPANIALIKYWGKRDKTLNLPLNGSISISLGNLGTFTRIEEALQDEIIFNGQVLNNQAKEALKVWDFINLVVPNRPPIRIITRNTIPTAAGLASSASGFAALILALNHFFKLNLNAQQLAVWARRGSGSATRSLWHGFVKWQRGESASGEDSHGEPLHLRWDNFRIGLIEVENREKKVSSRDGMNHTAKTSPLFKVWRETAEQDFNNLESALWTKDFKTLGEIAEANALAMHATIMASRPAISYFLPQTLDYLQRLWMARAEGLSAYATIDAGPNIKLICLQESTSDLKSLFPQINFISPFAFLA